MSTSARCWWSRSAKSKQPGWTCCASAGEICFAPSSGCSREKHGGDSQVSFWWCCAAAKWSPSASADKWQIPSQEPGKAAVVVARTRGAHRCWPGALKEDAETGGLTLYCAVGEGFVHWSAINATFTFWWWGTGAEADLLPHLPAELLPLCMWHSSGVEAACISTMVKLDQAVCKKKKKVWYTTAVRVCSNIHNEIGKHFVCWWKYLFLPH